MSTNSIEAAKVQQLSTQNCFTPEIVTPPARDSPSYSHDISIPHKEPSASTRPNSTRIFFDTQGVHDFDLKNRPNGPRKLTKSGHRVSKSLSLSTTANSAMEVSRSNSDVSDQSSIRKRLSSFITSPISPSYKLTPLRSSSATATITLKREEDPLPDKKKELESRLNYHLAELDELKRTVKCHNDMIRTADSRLRMIQSRYLTNQTISTKKLIETVETAMCNRDAYAKFVDYHRDQLERIKHKRISLDKEAGVESPTVPEVFNRIWKYDDWAALFSVGR